MIRIGRISYANCTPIFRAFEEIGGKEKYDLVSGVPAELNAKLRTAEIDICPSSSFEYALNPHRYKILPDLSISSDGEVGSVLLFSPVSIEKLGGHTICLSGESATSVNLLKIIISEFFKLNCSYKKSAVNSEAFPLEPQLLIGDAALRESMAHRYEFIYDLGALWKEWTSLPFVFALWLVTAESANNNQPAVANVWKSLLKAREVAAENYTRYAALSDESSWFGAIKLENYWKNNISYYLTDRHIAGLELFYAKAFAGGLILEMPKIDFLQGNI